MEETRRIPVVADIVGQFRNIGGSPMAEQFKNELTIAGQLGRGSLGNGTSNPHMDMLLGTDEKICDLMHKLIMVLDPKSKDKAGELSSYRDMRFDGTLPEQERQLAQNKCGSCSIALGDVRRVIMGLDRFHKKPCGFCFVEYYTREDAENALRYISGTRLDDRLIRCDWDAGFKEGRQYGRGKHGGQAVGIRQFRKETINSLREASKFDFGSCTFDWTPTKGISGTANAVCMADRNGVVHYLHNGVATFTKRNSHRASTQKCPSFSQFKPKRALIVSKSSLLEYEFDRRGPKNDYIGLDDSRFLKELGGQHVNVDDMRVRHKLQRHYLDTIVEELRRHNIEWKIVRRRQYSETLAQWADLIISAGGDGTFLTASKRIPDGRKPVIGINTDPVGSEGFLCLTGKSRRPADEVIKQFLEESSKPNFHWMHRQRIRVTILKSTGPHDERSLSSSSIYQQMAQCEQRDSPRKDSIAEEQQGNQSDDDEMSNISKKSKFSSDDEEQHSESAVVNGDGGNFHRLALNEVFIGESHAARVSYYDVQVDNGPMTKQKSSGMTICTGTGSTSWHYNINRLTEQTLGEIFTEMSLMGISLDREVDSEMVEGICRHFNSKLKFGPEQNKMAFSVRDPVFNATFPKTPIRGFAHKILLKSRCTHADLILDGSTSIPFNHRGVHCGRPKLNIRATFCSRSKKCCIFVLETLEFGANTKTTTIRLRSMLNSATLPSS
uniref:NAD(+) kinase n=1 Tax=Globodera pallida TaxID=36090 RepID=A0A183BV71_GLOPA